MWSVKNRLRAKAPLGRLSLAKVLHFVHNEVVDPGEFPRQRIWREVADVLVMTPAVGEGTPAAEVNAIRFGVLKLAWFGALENSARNWGALSW